MTERRGPKIEFRFQILPRRDVDVWVGYIPALRLYAQAKSEEGLKQALEQNRFLLYRSVREAGNLGQGDA